MHEKIVMNEKIVMPIGRTGTQTDTIERREDQETLIEIGKGGEGDPLSSVSEEEDEVAVESEATVICTTEREWREELERNLMSNNAERKRRRARKSHNPKNKMRPHQDHTY